jgi:hypothetical protein
MSIMRRVRGALGVATLWGVTWGVAGSAFITWRLWTGFGSRRFPWHFLSRVAVQSFVAFAVAGAIAGAAFSLLLAGTERRRTVDSLSVPRAAVWGALAGVAMTLGIVVIGRPPLVAVGVLGSLFATLGAVSAATTVSLARRAPALEASEPEEPLLVR